MTTTSPSACPHVNPPVTATLASSSLLNTRPRIGATPSVRKKSLVTVAPGSRSGSPAPVRLKVAIEKPAMRSIVRVWARQSRKSPGVTDVISDGVPSRLAPATSASRALSAYGSGLTITALTKLKIAVVPPMPIASVRMATAVNPGFRASIRRP